MTDTIKQAIEAHEKSWDLIKEHCPNHDGLLYTLGSYYGEIKKALLAQQDNGWQPIESAPKDGSNILLRYFKGKPSNWQTIAQDAFYVTEGFYTPERKITENYTASAEWRDYAGRVLRMVEATTSKNHITHWMPLPKPPTQGDGE